MKISWAGIIALLVILALVVPVSATYTDAIGFKWDTSSNSPTLTRVFANGTTASVDGDYFNNHAIWGGIKKVLVDPTTGEVTYGTNNRGDGLDLNGTGRKQVMVEYPMFYTFESYNAPFLTYIVSPTQYNSSFKVHPMFYQRGDGTPAAHYYVGAYEMQTETVNGSLVGTSYTGKTPVVSQTIGTMRTYAERNGPRWGLINVWTRSGIRELLYIETGTLNSQIAWSKSRGVVDSTAAMAAGADSADTNTFAVNATGGGTGTNGKTPVVWRALQDFWGNTWEFNDGQNSYTSGGNSIWRNINRTGLNTTGGQTKFQDLLIAGDYETSTTTTIADGYQTSVATGAADRLLMIPTAVGGSETTYLADYFWYPRSTDAGNPNILAAGGYWEDAGLAGAGHWHSYFDASGSDARLGARLEFRPQDSPGPIASFTQNKTHGIYPLAIDFTDTSTNTPNIWVWSVDGIEIQNSSITQNFIHTFESAGTYQVNLTVWNTDDATTPSTASQDIFVSSTTYSDFTISKNHPIIFEDTVIFTPIGPFTADQWFWNFGDGTTFLDLNGTAVTHKYNSISSNSTLNPSLTANSSAHPGVTNTSSLPIYPIFNASYIEARFTGIPLQGSSGLNVLFTDQSVYGSTDGLAYNWSFGDDGYSLSPYSNVIGDVNHVYSYLGTYSVKLTVSNTLNSSTMVKTNYVVISNNQQTQTTFYSPHQVVFQILDSSKNPISGTHVSAHAVESTLPGGLSGATQTIQNAYGVPRETAELMLSEATEYSGTTDTSGYVTILMLSTIKYQVNVTDTSGAIQSVTVMPQDAYYQISTFNSTTENIFNRALKSQDVYTGQSVFNASFYKPNSSYGTMINYLYDASGKTTGANCWFRCVDNGTTWWYNRTWAAGSSMQTISMTVPVVPYQQWKWGCDTLA